MNKTSNSLPQAYVSVGKNKSRLKIYSDKNVFLKDKEEFQIELFNPTTKVKGVKILINGNPISASLLVIKPGERVYLERYIDDNKKFLFETYQVENSMEVKEAIKNNGNLRIEFYDEKEKTSLLTSGSSITYVNPYYVGLGSPYYGTVTTPGLSGCIGTNGASGIIGGSSMTTATYSCSNNTSSAYFNAFNLNEDSNSVTSLSSDESTNVSDTKSIETGRIEKGSTSNQNFDDYYGDFQSYSSSSIEYKLLPESAKPIEVKEIRNYCGNCRTRIKKASWNFCVQCGEEL